MKPLDDSKWWLNSGGVMTKDCGPLVSDTSLVFINSGVRALITQDLDMTLARSVIRKYLVDIIHVYPFSFIIQAHLSCQYISLPWQSNSVFHQAWMWVEGPQ